MGGNYLVELVALNDFNEADKALVQARKMAIDPGVLGVLGGWTPETAQTMSLECSRLGLAFITPDVDWTSGSPDLTVPADPAFVAGYEALSGGAQPGPAAIWAYAQANRLLDAFDATLNTEGRPSRERVEDLIVFDY